MVQDQDEAVGSEFVVVLPDLTGVGLGLEGSGAVDCVIFAHTIVKSFDPDLQVLLVPALRSRELDVNSLAQAVRALFEFWKLNGNFRILKSAPILTYESYN